MTTIECICRNIRTSPETKTRNNQDNYWIGTGKLEPNKTPDSKPKSHTKFVRTRDLKV